ncbi:MAG: SAM-dependent methyltransferase [Marinilabiliales bacterium]|nr:MAG: SAM-dependent methyltransferase [Marinilabiliales bacterium]
MKEFWNERYAKESYVYGTSPNAFFKEQLSLLDMGTILLPAEGEGRNAVYAAKLGWDVYAFDYSAQAQHKAIKLSEERRVSIHYEVASFDEITFKPDFFDCIALFFVHVHPDERKTYHRKIVEWLKLGGTLLLEGFSKEQINKPSGGPKNINMLFSEKELTDDFNTLRHIEIYDFNTHLDEGSFHQGEASVIRMKGIK